MPSSSCAWCQPAEQKGNMLQNLQVSHVCPACLRQGFTIVREPWNQKQSTNKPWNKVPWYKEPINKAPLNKEPWNKELCNILPWYEEPWNNDQLNNEPWNKGPWNKKLWKKPTTEKISLEKATMEERTIESNCGGNFIKKTKKIMLDILMPYHDNSSSF